MSRITAAILVALCGAIVCGAQVGAQPRPAPAPEWARLEQETMEHFQAILRIDTSNPPGRETAVVDYLKKVLTAEGIPVEVFALEADRANLVARVKGNGRKRPLLIAGHTDVVTVEPSKWTFPPFSATRDGGYVYGRGALDDKPHVVAGLMMLLTLKRLNVPLDRDVIFLAEAGEEGTTRVGVDFLIERHFDAIDAEFCLAEGGGVRMSNGRVQFASIGTMEKTPRTILLTARGPSAHGSVPISANAVARLSAAVARVTAWQSPIKLNETTRAYFERMAGVSSQADAARFKALLGTDQKAIDEAAAWLLEHSPANAAVLRTTVSPVMLRAGNRNNVIPSEATATLDVRVVPDDDPDALIDTLKQVVADPSVEVSFAKRDGLPRPRGRSSVDTDAFRAIETAVSQNYDTVTIPAMGTGATDSAQLRSKGIQCYGMGPAVDVEEGPKGFGAHSDQERILERELHRFVRFTWDIVMLLARTR
jgi:acetylornithine deacetylase/succinyl-diaminopimelate desuccinylase-like protein